MTHANNDVRSAFEEAVDAGGTAEDARAASGKVWNCTDIMPRDLCNSLDVPQGSTYAKGARIVRSTSA